MLCAKFLFQESMWFIHHRCKSKPVCIGYFLYFVCLACPFVLVSELSNIMQPIWLEDMCTEICCILCLTYMSMCPLLQDGCSSFDIALELGKKIKSLQVATCGASSEKDKKLDEKTHLHSSFLVVLKLILCWLAS